jgi:hypothetical protein
VSVQREPSEEPTGGSLFTFELFARKDNNHMATKNLLTTKEAQFIKKVKAGTRAAGLSLPTTQIISEAVKDTYDVSGAKDPDASARALAGQILERPRIKAALGFDSDAGRSWLSEEMERNLRGENPLFPGNLDIYRDTFKLAVRLAFAEKVAVTNTVAKDYAHMSLEELRKLASGEIPISDDDL